MDKFNMFIIAFGKTTTPKNELYWQSAVMIEDATQRIMPSIQLVPKLGESNAQQFP